MTVQLSISLDTKVHNLRSARFFEFSNYRSVNPLRTILDEAENYLEFIPDSSVNNYMNSFGTNILTEDNTEYLRYYIGQVKIMLWCIDANQ